MRTPRERVSLTWDEIDAIDQAVFDAGARLLNSPMPESEYLQELRRTELNALITAGVKMQKAARRMRRKRDDG